MVWQKALSGEDVFVQGDGWVFHARTQGWLFEPNLLTMPAMPMEARFANEVERLSTDWPTLKDAWAWRGPYAGGWLAKAGRVWVLFAGLYNAAMLPIWVLGWTGQHHWGDTANHAAIRGLFFGVGALFCLFLIWHSHVWRKDPHKGLLIAGVAMAAHAWREHERRAHWRPGGYR